MNRKQIRNIVIMIPLHHEQLSQYLSPIVGQHGILVEKLIERIFECLKQFCNYRPNIAGNLLEEYKKNYLDFFTYYNDMNFYKQLNINIQDGEFELMIPIKIELQTNTDYILTMKLPFPATLFKFAINQNFIYQYHLRHGVETKEIQL